jgi:hypothetical protein
MQGNPSPPKHPRHVAVSATTKSDFHLQVQRLPKQHNNIKKTDTTQLNGAKETGSCPDSNRGPLAIDI